MRAVDAIQSPVNHDTSDGNVGPNGKSPACNAAMQVKALQQSAAQSNNDQWHDASRQNCVGSEQSKVQCAGGAMARKSGNAVVGVIP